MRFDFAREFKAGIAEERPHDSCPARSCSVAGTFPRSLATSELWSARILPID
jgi:hypothetical protein